MNKIIWFFILVVLSPIFFILLIKPVTFLVQRIKAIWTDKKEEMKQNWKVGEGYLNAQFEKGKEYREKFNKKIRGVGK